MGIATALTLKWLLPTLEVLLICGSLSLKLFGVEKKLWNVLTRKSSLLGYVQDLFELLASPFP